MKWLITGGAGFIGSNVARRLIQQRHSVVVFDNLSRPGAAKNLEWLRGAGNFQLVTGDVRDFSQVAETFKTAEPDVVLHLAAQVAVTTSVADPRHDFEVNAAGTFNVCEAVRQFVPSAILLNASTNKVYGAMTDLRIELRNGRYEYRDFPNGMSEAQPLDFHSPYGCSKGSADQYVKDYAAIYGLRTVTFRQSCIYGHRQFGVEDQGWVAWFTIAAVFGRPITIYGDGRQVRDILFVEDLVDCYLRSVQHIDNISGHAYNIGGGPRNSASLLEILEFLERALGKKLSWATADWRPGDQRVFVSDITKAKTELGWEPTVSKEEGTARLVTWVLENRNLFEGVA